MFESPSYLPTKDTFAEQYGMKEDDADLYMGLSVLANHVSALVSDVQLHVGFEELKMLIGGEEAYFSFGAPIGGVPPAMRQTWRCPSLISAIYMQFYLLLTDSRPMRSCENPACGMPFPATRKNRRFCNDTCRSNARHYR